MAEYISYFIEDPRQLWALGSVALLWLGMTAIGHLFVRDDEETVVAPVVGWSVIVAVYTVLGTLTDISFTSIAIGLAALACVSGVMALRRDVLLFDPIWLRMIVLAAPLLIMTSAMQGSQWDEFSHWLTGQAYLLRVDYFPGEGHPTPSASYPAYPYGWQILGYLASRIAGFHIESAGPLLNILLLLTLGRVVIAVALESVGKDIRSIGMSPWLIAGMAGASVTLLNPTFVQKVILTAYADTATSVSLALGIIFGARAIVSMEQSSLTSAIRGLMVSGLVLAVLVTLKQSTLELFLLALISLGLFGIVSNIRAIPRVSAAVLIVAIPGIVLYVIWRMYVAAELVGAEFSFLPYDEWNIDLIPEILLAMGEVLLKKSAYLAAVLLAIWWGGRTFVNPAFSNRLLLAAALVFVGHIAFLFLCYVAVFTGVEARTAASFWRYNQQLGGLAIITISVSVAWLLTWLSSRVALQRVAWLPVALLVVLPFVFAHKLRFDTSPSYSHYRAASVELMEHVSVGSKVFVLDPVGSGESAIIARFQASPLEIPVSFMSVHHDTSEKNIRAFMKHARGAFVIVHSVTPDARAATGLDLADRTSYLLRVGEDGEITELATWPWPDDMRLK